MDDQVQKQIFQAMENPLFYPHPVSCIQQVDTHISKVFLTGDYAYKIKKAVNHGFVDFSSLEKRRYYCCRELFLNSRLSRDTYVDVVTISCSKGMISLEKKGVPVEYAVRMRQLCDATALGQLIKAGEVSKVDMVALGRMLSRFYRDAPESETLPGNDGWKTIFDACSDNFKQTENSCGTLLDRDIWETVKGATLSFLKNHRAYFGHRHKTGKIRDCHGDLRCDHIYFTATGIQVIDCIEFNDRFRHIDVISDLAFLLMDLDFHQEPALGDCLLNEFLRHTDDTDAILMLSFYKCYRAMVRCKVNCIFLQSRDVTDEKQKSVHLDAIKALDLAFQYALQFFRPCIWVICGMPATGKSTIARRLSEILGIDVIRSDLVRKQIFGLEPHESGADLFGEKIYSVSATSLTYGKLLRLAQEKIENSTSVILDATYSREKYRDEVITLAKDKGVKPIFIECRADIALIKERLMDRQFHPSVSDARLHHFEDLTARYERFRYAGNALHIPVNTALPIEEGIRRILIKVFRIEAAPIINIAPTGPKRVSGETKTNNLL